MSKNVLLKFGFHLGGRSYLWKPTLNTFLGKVVNKVFLFDLNKTHIILFKALSFVKKGWLQGNTFVVVEKSNIEKIFYSFYRNNLDFLQNRFYFVNKWYGGFFSNFFTLFPTVGFNLHSLGIKSIIEKKLSFQLLNVFPNIGIVGSMLHDIAALKEMNLLNIPCIGVVDGVISFSGGGITFPIFAKSFSITRLFLLKKIISCFWDDFFFFSPKPLKKPIGRKYLKKKFL